MLINLHIQNFAIIDNVDIDITSGLTALTGETGAGKSILLDALGLVLGDRCDSGSIKTGADRADISASFDITALEAVRSWLENQTLDNGNECILRRTINQDGRSKGFINGTPVTVQNLKTLGEMLVDIHGQHEHQSLMKRDIQLQRLDAYAKHEKLVQSVADHYHNWKTANQDLIELQNIEHNRNERLDTLRYQLQELEPLALTNSFPEEWQAIQVEHQRLANANELITGVNQSLYALFEDDNQNTYQQLSEHYKKLSELAAVDNKLQSIAETLQGALIQCEDTAGQLRDYLAELENDPARLDYLNQRIDAIVTLARKHRVEPHALYAVETRIRDELNTLENTSQKLQELTEKVKAYNQQYLQSATKLTQQRKKFASKLSDTVTKAMQTLNMPGARLVIEIETRSYYQETGEGFSAQGLDSIEYNVSTNPGQNPKPLRKIASGGELARMSLAIQMVTANIEPIPTLIFDEVDTGIGGKTAEIVGAHLRQLGEQRQVLCVTHLAQVASQAHHHLSIQKSGNNSKRKTINTQIGRLSAKQRIDEIARMLGGIDITPATLSHAKEMLSKAGNTGSNTH